MFTIIIFVPGFWLFFMYRFFFLSFFFCCFWILLHCNVHAISTYLCWWAFTFSLSTLVFTWKLPTNCMWKDSAPQRGGPTPLHVVFPMAVGISITSWNIRGLKDTVKRKAIFDTLCHQGSSIACIQEMHLTKDILYLLNFCSFSVQYHSVFFILCKGC